MNQTTNKSNRPTILPTGVYSEPKYLRPDSAASRLSVTPAFLYKLMGNGTLPFHKLGGARLIKVSDLDALVESNA
jgi:excisionase family DNA binding protein